MLEVPKSFNAFFLPLFVFFMLDYATTYLGVCVLSGGFEMNSSIVALSQYVGYIAIGCMYVFAYALGSLMLAKAYDRTKSQFRKIFMIVAWSMLLFGSVSAVILNITSLVYMTTGVRTIPTEMLVPYTPEQINHSAVVFESHRQDFCRLV